MMLPFLDDSFHLASNDDIEPIYYSEQQYFHWKNRNNMLFIRYLRTAWTTPSPNMGHIIWVQRSVSYCTIMDSIVRTDRHADVILTAYFGFQLLILTRCRTRSNKATSQNSKNLFENLSWVLYKSNLNKLTIFLHL